MFRGMTHRKLKLSKLIFLYISELEISEKFRGISGFYRKALIFLDQLLLNSMQFTDFL